MAKVVNARTVSGKLLSFEVVAGTLRNVATQVHAAAPAPAPGSLALATARDLNALPPSQVVDAGGALLLPAGAKPIACHSEDQCTVDCNHDRLGAGTRRTDNAAFAVHSEIRSSAAAHASTRAILDWARTSYKRPIHIAHVSTPLEVELI